MRAMPPDRGFVTRQRVKNSIKQGNRKPHGVIRAVAFFRVRRGTSQRKPALLRLAAVRAAVGRVALGACGTLLGGLSVAVFAVGLVGHIVFHLLLLLVCADRRAFIPKGVSLASATLIRPLKSFYRRK